MYHFADDKWLLYFNNSNKELIDSINLDKKHLTIQPFVNKIFLSGQKAVLIALKPKERKLKILKSRPNLWEENVSITNCYIFRYWKSNCTYQIHDVAVKLTGPNLLLHKIRNCIDQNTLSSIYFAIFDSYLNYANQVWVQNSNGIKGIVIIQKKL